MIPWVGIGVAEEKTSGSLVSGNIASGQVDVFVGGVSEIVGVAMETQSISGLPSVSPICVVAQA